MSQVDAQTYFNTRIDNNQSWWDYSWNLYADSTSIYWTYGTSTGLGLSGFRVASIARLDLSGNIVSVNNYLDTDTNFLYYFGGAKSLTKLFDGFILGGTWVDRMQKDAVLLRLDNSGDTLWTRNYGDSTDQSGWMAIEDWDNGFLLCGQSESIDTFTNALVIRTDSMGNVLWQTEVGVGGYNERFVSICRTANGCALAGRKRDLFNLNFDTYVALVDSFGVAYWDTSFITQNHDELWSITSTQDGNFVVAGDFASTTPGLNYPYVAKFDLNGQLLWQRKYGDSLLEASFNSIRELDDGSFILTGKFYLPDTPWKARGLISKIASNGDSIWSMYYYNSFFGSNFLMDIIPIYDGSYVSCGVVFPSLPDTGHQDLWLLRVDSMGCEQVNCIVGIAELQLPQNIQVYPNPFHDQIRFKLPDEIGRPSELIIWDMLGREAYRTHIPQSSVDIDLAYALPGIYFAQIISHGKQVFSCKIIKN